MLRELLPLFERGRLHALAQPALAAAGDARVTRRASWTGPPGEVVPEPKAALERARELAGPDGAVLATGSIYLIADLVAERSGARASTL